MGDLKDFQEQFKSNGLDDKPKEYYFSLDDVRDDFNELYKHGNPRGYYCGFPDFHNYFSLLPGRMTFINGAPDSGKTYFWFEILINLSEFHGLRHMIFSPEMGDAHQVFAELVGIYMKSSFMSLDKDDREYGSQFINDHFLIIDPQDNTFTVDEFLNQAELYEAKGNKKIDTLTGDPFNEFTHTLSDDYNRQDLYIERILGNIRRKAKSTGRHICIITHPRDQQKDIFNSRSFYRAPTAREYAGGQAWYRKGFGMLCIWRPPEGYELDGGEVAKNNTTVVQIQKAKPRGMGKKGNCVFYLDMKTSRYYQEDTFMGKIYAKKNEQIEAPF